MIFSVRNLEISSWRLVTSMLLAMCSVDGFADEKGQGIEGTNEIQVSALDLKSQQSRTLFVLDKMQSVGSIDVSQGGQKIAFDGTAIGEKRTSDAYRIWICRLDGSEMTSVAPGIAPSWSPRGKRIAFTKTPNQGVWLMQEDGSNDQLIDKSGRGAKWSPDGQKVAYVLKTDNEEFDIIVFNIVEDEYLSVLAGAAYQFESISVRFDWSPDSKSIYFMGRHKNDDMLMFRASADGSTRPEKHYAALSNTEAAVACLKKDTLQIVMSSRETRTQQLYSLTFDSETKKATPVYIHGQTPNRFNTAAALTNDGQVLIYISNTVSQ